MMMLRMLVGLGSWSATSVLGMCYDDGAADVGCPRLAVTTSVLGMCYDDGDCGCWLS